ncbi:MAG: hypothetical protein GXY15_08090 [Candidatus Hydrogenedentes bacterium]|mgnify:FL=1|nr:hypothetical protein [Candidatus Hydrogenedentota bacterium]
MNIFRVERNLQALGAVTAGLLLLLSQEVFAAPPKLPVQPFGPGEVRLLDGPFRHAQDLGAAYLLSLEPDRLLAGFRKEAGLPEKAEAYGGWERQGVAGHSAGHYLSACAFMAKAAGDARFCERAAYMVDGLAACQQANGNGYVAAIPGGKEVFEKVARGEIASQGFDLNGSWVPWYTLHKLFAGLRDTYRLCGNEKALAVARGLADFSIETTKNLSEEQWQTMLACEHGGINEVLADLAADTGEAKYLDLAKKFYHRAVLDPLAEGRDELQGKHANTQFPKVIGCERIHELTGEAPFGAIPPFFWNTVTHDHTYAVGGNSNDEHFGEPGKLNDRLGANTCETCNTYNMVKLTGLLFRRGARAELADYAERALWNHLLASQNPDDGMVLYYLTLKPGGQKTFMTPFDSFTCCSGTGMENHARHGVHLYARDAEGVYVNQFIASELDWAEKGVRLRLDTELPKSGAVRITIGAAAPVTTSLRIRHPHWAPGPLAFAVNGTETLVSPGPGGYADLRREWEDGDVVTFELPLALRTESMPDNPNRVAVFHGPVVLAADLGTEAENRELPVLVTDGRPVSDWLKPVAGETLTFRTEGAGRPEDLTLTPFHSFHGRRHTVYLDLYTEDEWRAEETRRRAEEARLHDIEERTVDRVRIGEMQPERDHNLEGDNTGAGDWQGRKWRHATDGGWFAFDLQTAPDASQDLVVTYWGSETGARTFDVLVDGQKLATQTLDNDKPGEFFDTAYPLPEKLLKGKKKITVRFQAHPGNFAGGIFDARIMRKK